MRHSIDPTAAPVKSLWIVPLVAGLLPATAALASLWLSIALDLVPPCNPFFEGCVSISRVGRHDLPNHIFRALVLPAAALQALTWMLCARWLRAIGAQRRAMLRVMPWLGVIAAVFLVLYVTFLGTDGEVYRWMRRYGVIFYFGFTYLCMLVASGELWRLARSGALPLPARLEWLVLGLCVLVLCLGFTQAFVPGFLEDAQFKRRLENALEWHTGLAFTLFFAALAWLWRHTRFMARLSSDGYRNPAP